MSGDLKLSKQLLYELISNRGKGNYIKENYKIIKRNKQNLYQHYVNKEKDYKRAKFYQENSPKYDKIFSTYHYRLANSFGIGINDYLYVGITPNFSVLKQKLIFIKNYINNNIFIPDLGFYYNRKYLYPRPQNLYFGYFQSLQAHKKAEDKINYPSFQKQHYYFYTIDYSCHVFYKAILRNFKYFLKGDINLYPIGEDSQLIQFNIIYNIRLKFQNKYKNLRFETYFKESFQPVVQRTLTSFLFYTYLENNFPNLVTYGYFPSNKEIYYEQNIESNFPNLVTEYKNDTIKINKEFSLYYFNNRKGNLEL